MKSKDSLDSIIDNFGPMNASTEDVIETMPVTLWLPKEYKDKFSMLQDRTKRRFGKLAKEVLMKTIDKKLDAI